MNRSLLLPQPGSTLVAKSIQDLLVAPTTGYHYRHGNVAGPSLREFTRDHPITVGGYRTTSRTEYGIPENEWISLNSAISDVMNAYPSGFYNAGIQQLTLWDALIGAVYRLSTPIYVVRVENWRASRSQLERSFLNDLNAIGYPDKDAAMETLMRAGNYSRAEYVMSPVRRMPLRDFRYWYRSLPGPGRRIETALRRITT